MVPSSRTPRACLSDMPWHIKQRIVGSADPITRLFIRQVSKELGHYVDHSPTAHYLSISFGIQKTQAVLELCVEAGVQPFRIEYRRANPCYSVQKLFNWRQVGGRFNPVERAVKDLATILKNPNVSVTHFHLPATHHINSQLEKSLKTFPRERSKFFAAFQKEFSKLRHLQSFEGVFIGFPVHQKELMQFLPLLKPRTLNWLVFESIANDSMENVMETEQYQQVDGLGVRRGQLSHLMKGRIATITKIYDATVSLDELKELITVLLQKHDDGNPFDFELRDVNYNKEEFLGHLFDFYGVAGPAENQDIIKMPDSDNYLSIVYEDPHLCFYQVNAATAQKILEGGELFDEEVV